MLTWVRSLDADLGACFDCGVCPRAASHPIRTSSAVAPFTRARGAHVLCFPFIAHTLSSPYVSRTSTASVRRTFVCYPFCNQHGLLWKVREIYRIFSVADGCARLEQRSSCVLAMRIPSGPRALDFFVVHPHDYRLISEDWATAFARKELMPSFEFIKRQLAAQLGGAPDRHSPLALSL